jgi:hypothetical protein
MQGCHPAGNDQADNAKRQKLLPTLHDELPGRDPQDHQIDPAKQD